MKVLIIGRTIPTKSSGSIGLFEFQQAQAISKFEKTGFVFVENSSILTNRKAEIFKDTVDGIPVVGVYLPIKGLPGFLYDKIRTFQFIKVMEAFINSHWKPDVIHVHFPVLVLNDGILEYLKNLNIKLIVTEHWTKVQKMELSTMKNKLLREIISVSHKVICVSEELQESVTKINGQKDTRIIVIPNMISDVFFKSSRRRADTNNVLFTFIGRLVKVKQVGLLIEAFQEAFLAEDPVRLTIVGDGPDRDYIRTKIKHEFKDKILLVGNKPKEEVAEILRSTSVYVSASEYETFGVPFVEALAVGIPIIVADNIPIRTYVNEQNGRLFQVNNKEDLIEKMRFLYQSIDSFKENIIKENIYNIFSEEAVAKKILASYN